MVEAVAAPAVLQVDENGLLVESTTNPVLDVGFDARRVWSLRPERDGVVRDGHLTVPWPPALRDHLEGVAQVSVHEHGHDVALFDDQVQFGSSTQPVTIEDAEGRPLGVDKTGSLVRLFAQQDGSALGELVDATARLLDILNDVGSGDAFVAFGSLLGAVRSGHVIGHDCDADVAYLSPHTHPSDVLVESFGLEREVRATGLETVRMSHADFKVYMTTTTGDRIGIDVFGAFHVDDVFHLMPNVRGDLPRAALVPLSTVSLEGRDLPAPANPEALLALTYGPEWRVPDPAFHFEVPESSTRRFHGWTRDIQWRRAAWQGYWATPGADLIPTGPSPMVSTLLKSGDLADVVVDVACGNGRDAVAIARTGRHVVAWDVAQSALDRTRSLADDYDVADLVETTTVNLFDQRDTLGMAALVGHRFAGQPVDVYARFVFSTVRGRCRRNFWSMARTILRLGGRLHLEFRTLEDVDIDYVFSREYRVHLDPDEMIAEAASHDLAVVDKQVGRGLARLAGEDPHMCRLILEGT